METQFKVLRSYRALMRASRITFKGDASALVAARERIRGEYLAPGPVDRADMLQRLQMAKDVAHILRSNVVQATANDDNVYKLELHEDSELGDNDSRFIPVEHSTDSSQGCCGGQATGATST